MTQKQIEQAAMEIGENNESCYLKYDGETETTSYKECLDSALEMAKWLLSHQWISVEDELPDEDGNYLGTKYKDGKEYITLFVKWSNDKHKFNTTIDITHWMPIPKIGGEK